MDLTRKKVSDIENERFKLDEVLTLKNESECGKSIWLMHVSQKYEKNPTVCRLTNNNGEIQNIQSIKALKNILSGKNLQRTIFSKINGDVLNNLSISDYFILDEFSRFNHILINFKKGEIYERKREYR